MVAEPAFESPIARATGIAVAGLASEEDSIVARRYLDGLVEEAIGSCMKDEGFDYYAETSDEALAASMLVTPVSDEDLLEWGFGLSTRTYTGSAVGPGLLGREEEFDDFSLSDRNTATFLALDEAGQDAYLGVLYGSLGDSVGLDDDAPAEGYEPGCIDAAYDAVYSEEVERQAAFYEAFQAELDDMAATVANDPKLLDLRRQIESCLARRGSDHLSRDEMEAAIVERLDASNLEFEYESTGTMVLKEASRATLERVQSEELQLAHLYVECAGGEVATLAAELSVEAQGAFVEEHADTLALFREDLANGE